MSQTRIRHGILLPMVWLTLVFLLWRWPGDKGLNFYFGAFAGAWVHELVSLTGRAALTGQCLGGLLVMHVVGWLMDRKQVGYMVYTAFIPFVAGAVWIGPQSLSAAFMILCWGLYAVGVAGLMVVVFKVLRQHLSA